MRSVLSIAVLLVLANAPAALADCAAPHLRLTASTREPRQGAVVPVVLRSDVPLASAVLTGEGERVPLEADASGRVFRGLVGVDFEAKTGAERFEVETADSCGASHAASLSLRVLPGAFPSQRLTLEPKYVEPPESEKERIASDHAKVQSAWDSGEAGRRWPGIPAGAAQGP